MTVTAPTSTTTGRFRSLLGGGRMRELGILLALVLVVVAATV